jgi:DNA-directed RNA polymerase alpha subunit
VPADPAVGWTQKQHRDAVRAAALELPMAETSAPVRVVNALETVGVFSVKDVLRYEAAQLLGLSNFGAKTLSVVRDAIVALGLEVPASWVEALGPPPSKPKKRARHDKKSSRARS